MRGRSRGATIIAGVVGSLGTAAAPASAGTLGTLVDLVGGALLADAHPIRVVSLNVCGANPDCASRGGNANVGAVVRLVDAAVASAPEALALQEVCATQAAALDAALAARGYRTAFVVTKTEADGDYACQPAAAFGGRRAFGNLVALRGTGPVTTQAAYMPRTLAEDVQPTTLDDLPVPAGAEQRKLVCITGATTRGRTLRACSVHLVAGEQVALRAHQVRRLAVHGDALAAQGVPAVIAGDLNTQRSLLPGSPPSALVPEDAAATDDLRAHFHDAAALLAPIPTSGLRRIDFVLGSRRTFRGGRALVVDAGQQDGRRISDHLGVTAELSLR